MSIAENVAAIKAKIAEAAIAAGRDPAEIKLCAATKMNDADAVRQAISAGVDLCGENRVQEMLEKYGQNAYEGAPLHFIGHLQTNKVRQVVGKADVIQSVDSLRLLSAIDREAARQGICQDVLLEVNLGGEESKSGFSETELMEAVDQIPGFANICVRGLMTIPPICQKSGENDKIFQKICAIAVDIMGKKYDNVSVEILSMGMSDDFADAIRCGSTMVRVGTAIFGARDYSKPHQV